MSDSKLRLVVVLWGNINPSFSMDMIDFYQHGCVCALSKKATLLHYWPNENNVQNKSKWDSDLGEVALLVDQSQHVHLFIGQNVQSFLVVLVVDALPHDVLPSVLLLLQLEHVSDEELLQLLVGVVDAELLKAAAVSYITNELSETQTWVKVLNRRVLTCL